MEYIFNHYYLLRHDEKRSILFSHVDTVSSVSVNKDWLSCIHPIYAMMLSFFSKPITKEKAIEKIADFFDFSQDYTANLVEKFIENKEEFHTEFCGHNNNFPKNIIIRADQTCYKMRVYTPDMFVYSDLDFKTFRLYSAPLYITFMVNNRCLTNCVYCYADRGTRCKNMNFSQVEKIIDMAHDANIQNIDLDGGEFFIYPHWKRLLEKLQMYEYKPRIVSTKYPVSEDDIAQFSTFGISLQVSLDSLNQKTLDNMVGAIKDYSTKMRQTIITIDKYMPFQVATILTKFNTSIDDLEQMYSFFCTTKRIRRWEIRVGFKSLYSKNDFNNIRIEPGDINKIYLWVSEKRKDAPFEIKWSPGREVNFFKSKNGGQDFIGGRCSGNTIHFFVLPDGKVTICEQLYWKKNFIIGDLTKQTIAEVWKSNKAMYLANMQQKDYSDDSKCKSCDIFDKCHSYMNKCYANILKAYGDEHWDYPDPRCARAPRNISDKIYV